MNDSLWLNAAMVCAICSHEWVATYPDTAPTLECPTCGYGNAAALPSDGAA